jgi:predicted TIM-barrel fold metal-dependent hydrolase
MAAVTKNRGVDAHAHVFSAEAPAVPGARYRPQYAAERNAWRSHWPVAGITHGVVVQPSFFGYDNREMLDTVASDSTHLRGVAVLPPSVDDATLKRFDGIGVRAMRLNLRGVRDFRDYSSAAWRSLFDRAHALGWHVECFIDTGRMADVAPALEASPVNVLFDHFGAPGSDRETVDTTFRTVRHLARTREVWCKLSGPYRLEGGDPREHAKRWHDAVGPSRLVWGSDWPWTGFERDHEYATLRMRLADWVDAKLERLVLWDNAARLYGFE